MSLSKQGIKAAIRYIKHKGYEVLDTIDEFIVAKEDSRIVFISVETNIDKGTGFTTADNISTLEKFALGWLAKQGESNSEIRLDKIAINVLNDDRAMIRHHVNVTSSMMNDKLAEIIQKVEELYRLDLITESAYEQLLEVI